MRTAAMAILTSLEYCGAFLVLSGTSACGATSSTMESQGLTAGIATVDSSFAFTKAHFAASASSHRGLDDPAYPNRVSVVIANVRAGDVCTSAQAVGSGSLSGVANLVDLIVVVAATDPTRPVDAGTYTLGHGLEASYRVADGRCATANEGSAMAGTAQIDRVDTSLHGTADLTFPTGRVVVTFDAPFCDAAIMTTTGDGGPSTCIEYPSCPIAQTSDASAAGATCLQ